MMLNSIVPTAHPILHTALCWVHTNTCNLRGQLRQYFAGYPSARWDCQAFANDFATCLSVVANPVLPPEGVVQIGKEYACQNLPATWLPTLTASNDTGKKFAWWLPANYLPAFAKMCRNDLHDLQSAAVTLLGIALHFYQILFFQASMWMHQTVTVILAVVLSSKR